MPDTTCGEAHRMVPGQSACYCILAELTRLRALLVQKHPAMTAEQFRDWLDSINSQVEQERDRLRAERHALALAVEAQFAYDDHLCPACQYGGPCQKSADLMRKAAIAIVRAMAVLHPINSKEYDRAIADAAREALND